MKHQASDLARRLADFAEAVCRYYLPNGRRQGRYWLVGDVQGSKGQSLYVRLAGDAAGDGGMPRPASGATFSISSGSIRGIYTFATPSPRRDGS